MRNRAKCKLCNSIIESFHSTDLVLCKCGEIEVDGGDALRCRAKDWNNFLRVDDQGNEIRVTLSNGASVEKELSTYLNESSKPHKADLLDALKELIKTYQSLPQHAKNSFVTNQEIESLLVLFLAIFEAKD